MSILKLAEEISQQASELQKACKALREPVGTMLDVHGLLTEDTRSDAEIALYEMEQERNVDHAHDSQ